MKSFIARVSLAVLFVVAAGALETGAGTDDANGTLEITDTETIEITVRPFCIVKGAAVEFIIVQAEVPYADVVTESVELKVYVSESVCFVYSTVYTEADSRGNLVAKFDFDLVEEKVEEPNASFYLIGQKTNGDLFEGQKEVRVHENPRG